MKLEYPKMIYKNGKPSNDKENYVIVKDEAEHKSVLAEWKDKGPAEVVKPTEIDDNKANVSDNSTKEDKPRHKKKAKKVSKKKV